MNLEGVLMARGDRDLGKEQFWRGILQEWEQSQKTVREFCVERGLVESRFYGWRRHALASPHLRVHLSRRNFVARPANRRHSQARVWFAGREGCSALNTRANSQSVVVTHAFDNR